MSSPVDPIVDILEAGAWTKVEFYLGRAVLLRPPAYLEEELALTGATPQLPRDAVFQVLLNFPYLYSRIRTVFHCLNLNNTIENHRI